MATIFVAIQVQAQTNSFFLSNPSLTPDGQTVVFCFEGDIWKAAIADGKAVRLTAMQGYESNPRVSPDGKWVAFTGRQFGNPDVFVIPWEGGEIKQLTWHSAGDEVSSWSWDSKYIYFNSTRNGPAAGYRVGLDGATPKRIFGDYFFQYDHNLLEHPSSGEIFFNDTWESSNQAQRKRYKGAFNPDIQSYNLKTKQYKKYTDWEGKDFALSLDKSGNMYFISDEANGEYNLYTLEDGKKKALTAFTTSIKGPQVNANGGRIVFEKDYQLYQFDIKTTKASKLDISIVRNNTLSKEQDFDVRGNISAFDVSPDGKKMVFVSRGEVFVSDVEGKFIQELNRHTAERVKEVKWLADNKTILYTQTVDGYSNLFTIPANATGSAKQLTSDRMNNRGLGLDKERKNVVYLCGREEVKLMDLKNFTAKTIAKDEIWGLDNSAPGFSPNGEYVLFTAYRNFEQDILVHHVKDNKTINLTNTAITEESPIWSSDGKYIYFGSQRLKPSYPMGPSDERIYRMALDREDQPYRMDKFDDLFKEEKKDEKKEEKGEKKKDKKDDKQDEKKDSTDKKPEIKNITIDTDRLMERLEDISPNAAPLFIQALVEKDDKTSVLYTNFVADQRPSLWKTTLQPFEQKKTEKIPGTESGGGHTIVQVDGKVFVLMNGTINKLNLDANKVDAISTSYSFRRNLAAEFAQMFDEAWAQMEENYYDEKFHGNDWKKTKAQYEGFVPFINNRGDLRVLLNDMLGELNSSHQGFGTFGSDETISLTNQTMETGLLFENDEPYKVKEVLVRSAADRTGVDVKAGDILLKVDGETIDTNRDRNYYFTRPSLSNEIKLTFQRNGKTIETKLHPQYGLYSQLYDKWVDNNQKRVDQKSKGRIAYGYMKNMGTDELEKFIMDMTVELDGKDALIFDLRYNTGGNVHDEVLRFLAQRSYLKWKYREGKLATQSNFAPSDKPIVLLINEQSLSDAEMTAAGFKALKLGTLMGNETYRWIIFTSGVGLVDNSFIRMPAWGCYTLDGKDLEVNGVQPDVKVINTFDDKITGKDPQLDRAIEEILKKLNSK